MNRPASHELDPASLLPTPSDSFAWTRGLPPTISRADAANYIGVSERTLDRAIVKGEMLTLKIGTRRLILRDSFMRWVESMID